jgi:hypothetical protein
MAKIVPTIIDGPARSRQAIVVSDIVKHLFEIPYITR